MMKLLGGMLLRDTRSSATSELAHAMAARRSGAGPARVHTAGPLTIFAAGEGAAVSRDESAIIAHDLDTLDDSQDVRALYRRHGLDGITRLQGGFALAIWDAREQQLVLATDRFGIKRLYHATTGAGFAFASTSSALMAAPGAARDADATAVYLYLNFGFVPAPYSILAGVRRLAPGHLLVVKAARQTLRRYWDMRYPEQSWALPDATAATFRMVEEAVARCVDGRPSKETGAFLSGGTDSSTIVGLMGRVTREPPNAFSIGFHEPRYNELHYAELAARHFSASHYTAIVTPDEAFAVLPRLVEAYDEPFGNSSMIPTYFCAKRAREAGVSVLLAGDGGDELFGGNERYRTHQIFAAYGKLPGPVRRGVIEPILFGLPDGGSTPLGKAQRYVRRARLPNPRRFYSYEFFAAREAQDLLTPRFLASVDTDAPWALTQEHFDRAEAASELNRLLYLDIKLAIGDNDLFKVTRTAGLAGIDVRFPMLDHRLAEFTGTLPARFKINRLEKRYLFKRAFSTLLPRAILTKPKHGFGLPVSDWLRSHRGFRELAHDTLLAPGAHTRAYFQPEAMRRLFRLHQEDTTPYHGDLLWTYLMLELWFRRHLTGARAA